MPLPVLHTSSSRIALDFVLNNGGSAFLPDHMVSPYLERGELCRVEGARSIPRNVYVVYWSQNDRLSQIERAVSFLARESDEGAEELSA